MEPLIARRYAQALLDFSEDRLKSERVEQDLRLLGRFIAASPEFSGWIADRGVPPESRERALREAFKDKLSPPAFIFLLFLEEKKRFAYLPLVCREFQTLYLDLKNTARADITSGAPLDEGQRAGLEKRLREKTKKEIRAEYAVDRSLLGGFKVKIGDIVRNNSIRYQLEKLKKELAGYPGAAL
jgi:F-type H+-transporting ATPase subunit delta